jgi:hypothetical protein
MVYSFAQIGATLSMQVEDGYAQNRQLRVRLHEKGGKDLSRGVQITSKSQSAPPPVGEPRYRKMCNGTDGEQANLQLYLFVP